MLSGATRQGFSFVVPALGARRILGVDIPFSLWQCAGMTTLATPDSPIDLREVTVRPTRGAREHRLWDRLVKEHHYLRFHGIIGKGLRHVALHGETWVALVGWQPGAFKLAARDRWIGWTAEQQFRRLHLIANNSRFVILGPRGVPNLASRVLGLSLRRLSADIEAAHGYPVLLAETFVDIKRFAGTCYRAANWRSLTGLEAGTGYSVSLQATHPANPAAVCPPGGSAKASGTTLAAAMPTITLTAATGDGQVTLSWTYTNDDGEAYDHWRYAQKKGSGSYSFGVEIPGGKTVRTHTVTGLENGAAYTFKVSRGVTSPPPAMIQSTADPDSNEVTATPTAAPPPPPSPPSQRGCRRRRATGR